MNGIYTSSEEMVDAKSNRFSSLKSKVTSVSKVVASKAAAPAKVVGHAAQGVGMVVASKIDDRLSIHAFKEAEKDEIISTGRALRAQEGGEK